MADTRSHPRTPSRRRPGTTSLARLWVAFLAPVAAIVILVAVATLTGSPDEPPMRGTAPDFTLTDTAGGSVELRDILADRDALLYFSMGVGCDGCFLQIPEVADELAARGIALVPIMVDRPDWVATEAARHGVDMPIAVDGDRAVSEAYGMLGQHGHGDAPSHSFALVRRNGDVAWVRHYAEMFVPAEQLLADLPA